MLRDLQVMMSEGSTCKTGKTYLMPHHVMPPRKGFLARLAFESLLLPFTMNAGVNAISVFVFECTLASCEVAAEFGLAVRQRASIF